jgi:hypothetical protein
VRGDRARLPRPSGGWPSADATGNFTQAHDTPPLPHRGSAATVLPRYVYRSIAAAESPQHVQVR